MSDVGHEGRILVISLSDLSRDPRVNRQIAALRGKYEIHAAGKAPSGLESRFFPLHHGRRERNWLGAVAQAAYDGTFWYKVLLFVLVRLGSVIRMPMGIRERILGGNPAYLRFIRTCRRIRYDLVIINDLSGLSLGMAVKGSAKVLFDAHEYSRDQSTSKEWIRDRKPYVEYLLRKYLPKVEAITTVCDGIADLYAEDHRIPRPTVITNATSYEALAPVHRADTKIRMVHHGVAGKLRMIEDLIRMMGMLDERFELDFYLVHRDGDYYRSLIASAADNPRIRFREPVRMQDIPGTLNDYDVGLALFAPVTQNLKHVLPNKFFEFVQARLAIGIGPSPEMSRLVDRYGLGVVAKEFTAESLAEALAGISMGDIRAFKANAHRCAMELSSAPQMEKLKSLVGSLISR